jgi:hypothetical protein
MKIIENLSIEIPGTNTHYFNLSEFTNHESDEALFFGYVFLENGINEEILKKSKKNIYLNVTMPTEFCSPQPTNSDSFFDEVYSICPFSNSWLNKINNNKKHKTIFYPYNKKDIPKNTEKIYDVIYHGGIHGNKYVHMLETISKYNYRYISQTHGINMLTHNMLKYATNTNLSNEEKLKIISQTKISICFNTFEIRNDSDSQNIKNRKDWKDNVAFKHIDDLKIVPQFKSRCNEAAFSRTLNLVQRDPWNIIERYYETDEFVYFDDIDDMKEKIDYILNNWDKFEPVIDKAFNKSMNYTTENLYKIIKNKKNNYDL